MNILGTVKDTFTTAAISAKEYFNEETTITRKTFAITCTVFVLIGVVYGFLISPIKKGIQVNVTNNNGDLYADDKE